MLSLQLAKDAGIDAAEGRLVDSDGFPVALIRRFDRSKSGERLMYVSAATMLGVERTDPEEHAYTEIVDAIRVNGAQAQADIDELWRRIAFSILITNVDDHLLNHGFLHDSRGLWRLGVVRRFVVSVLAFTLASFLCGIAWDLPALIIFRVLQGGVAVFERCGLACSARARAHSFNERLMKFMDRSRYSST